MQNTKRQALRTTTQNTTKYIRFSIRCYI